MLRYGNISEFDPQTGYARVAFIDDGIVSDWLQIIVKNSLGNKYFHAFEINEQVACLMDENLEDGVILGSIYSDVTPPESGNSNVVKVNFSDGSMIEYNRQSHEYNLDIKGKININATSDIKIESDSVVNVSALTANITSTTLTKIESPTIQLNGSVAVSGAITLTGTISSPGGAPISGNLKATGDIESGGNISTSGEISGGVVKDGSVTLGNHTHSGVTTGSGTTGPPTP